jgi:hypothetical protein
MLIIKKKGDLIKDTLRKSSLTTLIALLGHAEKENGKGFQATLLQKET